MRPAGRRTEPLTERDMEMLKEYFSTDACYQNMADKYGMSKAMVINRVRKYKKILEEQKQAEQKNNDLNEAEICNS